MSLERQLADYGQHLRRAIAGLEVPMEPGFSVRPVPTEPAPRRRWLIAAAGVAAAVAVLLAILLWPRSGDPAPFVEEGSTIPETSVTVPTALTPSTTTMAAIEYPWGRALTPDDSLVALSAHEAWVLSVSGGDVWDVWHLEGRRIFHSSLPAELAGRAAMAVAPDGTVLVAGENGVFSLDLLPWIRRSDRCVGAITMAPDGTVWIGGRVEGVEDGPAFWVARWDGQFFTRVEPWQIDPPGAVGTVAMAATSDGEVWISALGGYLPSDLMRYDGQTMETVRIGDYQDPWPDDAVGPVWVFDIEAAPNGDVWIGGSEFRDAGRVVLARFDGAEWTVYDWPFANGSPEGEPFPFDLAVGPDGTLWVNFPGGLGSYDGTTWSLRAASRTWERLPGPVDIAPDGTVWYSDADGLHTLTP